MSDDVYRRLARRLDEIPNGFAPTESGAEFRLLEKLYTPEEAGLACAMSLTPESPGEIARRVGEDAATVASRLREMSGKGLIRSSKGESGCTLSFRLSSASTRTSS